MGSESQFGCDKEKKSVVELNCFPADDAKMVYHTLAPVFPDDKGVHVGMLSNFLSVMANNKL